MIHIQTRRKVVINTDPQRRCYWGCHFKSEVVWSEWETLDWNILPEKIERRLEFWKELNDYAVSERGEGARCEYRTVEVEDESDNGEG